MTQNTAEILSQYEPLVRKVARRFAWSRLDPEDLQQTARLGIMRGLENYDTEKGALTPSFSGIAYNELATYCRRTACVMHQTSRARRLFQKAGIATRECGLEGAEARLAAAEKLGVDIRDVERVVVVMSRLGDDARPPEFPARTTGRRVPPLYRLHRWHSHRPDLRPYCRKKLKKTDEKFWKLPLWTHFLFSRGQWSSPDRTKKKVLQ